MSDLPTAGEHEAAVAKFLADTEGADPVRVAEVEAKYVVLDVDSEDGHIREDRLELSADR